MQHLILARFFYKKPFKTLETVYFDSHFNLVVEGQKGSQKAYAQLYKLYAKRMYNIALKIVNDEAEAADVLQESFFYAFTKIKDFKQEISFGLWIKQIVIHKAIGQVRKRKIVFVSLDDLDADEKYEGVNAEEVDIQVEVQKIRDAILLLPEGYRIVLTLYLLEGYDHEEIASILNISESASRSQLTRAKAKLISIINKKNG